MKKMGLLRKIDHFKVDSSDFYFILFCNFFFDCMHVTYYFFLSFCFLHIRPFRFVTPGDFRNPITGLTKNEEGKQNGTHENGTNGTNGT